MMRRTEDEIRNEAGVILGFNQKEEEVKQGTGQITTFNQLGFKGVNSMPDGWYLPENKALPAIVLETKSELQRIDDNRWIPELENYVNIILKKYNKCIGILYNGKEVRAFLNNEEIQTISPILEKKEYYLKFATNAPVDKQKIYNITKRINDTLHFHFGIKNLYHRMIFTACALVATRYGTHLYEGMSFDAMKLNVKETLEREIKSSLKENDKINLLLEIYNDEIKINNPNNQKAINTFIRNVNEISEEINSDNFQGEDVMAIFFNEFNRYKGKAEQGQIFTPEHIANFMYRLINVNKDSRILDACSGSGTFLVKAMGNMIQESGGQDTQKAKIIKSEQLFGVEFDREIYALLVANFLIHKDGKTNAIQADSRTAEVSDWIEEKKITKVLMNPPYENKYGCIPIVQNVLDSVEKDTLAAFILPDKKLEKAGGKKLLKKHTLEKIIKLPEETFVGVGITTSIFIFKTGTPHPEGQEIFACYIENDGLVTVKNQGRQDVYNRWSAIEDEWVEIIRKQSGHETIQWINPEEHLSWQEPQKPFEIFEEDFMKTALDYKIFKQELDKEGIEESLKNNVLYNSVIDEIDEGIIIQIEKGDYNE